VTTNRNSHEYASSVCRVAVKAMTGAQQLRPTSIATGMARAAVHESKIPMSAITPKNGTVS
jgi:hypothetical protein